MAKKGGAKRRNLSDKVALQKSGQTKKLGRFDIHSHQSQSKATRQAGGTMSRDNIVREYKRMGTANKFQDKRDKSGAARRFALERQRGFRKRAEVFNLGDSESLTHYGQNLADIERFDRPMESSDEEDERAAALNEEFVSAAHFGGGDLQNANPLPGTDRKSKISSLIAQSHEQKRERQVERSETEELRGTLDSQWRNLLQSGISIGGGKRSEVGSKRRGDAYDMLLGQLQGEGKGGQARAADQLAQDALQERKKLEKLEQERLSRMHPVKSVLTDNGSSLDDLEATPIGPVNNSSGEPITVRYSMDGRLIGSLGEAKNGGETKRQKFSLKPTLAQTGVFAVKKTGDSAAEEVPFVIKMPKSYFELKELLDHYHNGTVIERLIKCYHPSLKEGNKKQLRKLFLYLLRYMDEVANQIDGKGKVVDGATNQKSGKKEAPPTKHSPLTYLPTSLYNISLLVPEYAAECCLEVLRLYRTDSWQGVHYPKFGCFAYLKTVAIIFSVSDFRHPVGTPALLFGTQILTTSSVKNAHDLTKGLLLCAILLDFVKQSKRYLPEVLAFLTSALGLISGSDFTLVSNFLSVFSANLQASFQDVSGTEIECDSEVPLDSILTLVSTQNAAKLAAYCINCTITLLQRCAKLYLELPSFSEIFDPALQILMKWPAEKIPSKLHEPIQELIATIKNGTEASVKSVVRKQTRPKEKEFVFLEPRVETDFDPTHKKRPGGEKAQRKRLVRHFKREFRGTVRELRRDSQTLAKIRFDEAQALDSHRKRKTKELMHSLMGQESEYKKLKLKKS